MLQNIMTTPMTLMGKRKQCKLVLLGIKVKKNQNFRLEYNLGLDPDPEPEPDPDRHQNNADPQHWVRCTKKNRFAIFAAN
jgi:hypothetical protein